VLALAVLVYQPTPHTRDFGKLPFYYLAKLDSRFSASQDASDLEKMGLPVQKVWI